MRAYAFTHSFFGHPIMAALNLIGLRRAAAWVHDVALPVPVKSAADEPPVIFACQIHALRDGILRLEWQEPNGSGGGSFARSISDAMGAAKEMAMLLNGERPVERIRPAKTCEAWVEREWFWWVVKYRHKPGAVTFTVAARFAFKSSAHAVAAAVSTAHSDGFDLSAENAR